MFKKSITTIPIKKIDFSEKQYIKKIHPKHQIVLHHTVSGNSTMSDIRYWLSNTERIATCIIIARDGTPYQIFSSKYWAYHLGVKERLLRKYDLHTITTGKKLNQESIGIELDNWGWLTQKVGNGIFSWTGKRIPDENVIYYPDGFRGKMFYEKYTPEQIQTTKELLLYWNKIYSIPLDYEPDMWDISTSALGGKPGIWTHCSFRPDKFDIHPQPELIKMLKSLH